MTPTRRRRWPWLLGGLAVLLLAGAIFVNAQLEPHRLAATVLGQAGQSLQLKLTFRGTPDYAFRPEPRLVLPEFAAATLDGQVFLTAKRAEVSLPWSTVTGNEPVITRIELDAPVLDRPGLQRWLDSRPPTPFKLPTLQRGLAVREGTIHDSDWSLRALSLELPHLKTGDSAHLEARGVFQTGDTQLPFQAELLAATPGLASPIDLKLTLQPKAAAGEPQPAPIALALKGRYESSESRFVLQADQLGLVAKSPIPSLEGKGWAELAETANLDFELVLSRWPETWPKLPAALAARTDRLPVKLSYHGKPDFSEALSLTASSEDTELQASLRWPELRTWLAADAASPLPPLQASLKTPALDFDDIHLEGVEVEISQGGSAGASP